MAIDATVGGPNSNSFGTLSEALAFFANRLNSEAFTTADDTDQEKALIMSTLRLQQVQYDGFKSSSSQALPFPRIGLFTYDGSSIDGSTIPVEMKYAEFELALIIISTNFLA